MTTYEKITVIISFISLAISSYVLFTSNKFSRVSIEFALQQNISNALNSFLQSKQDKIVLFDENSSSQHDLLGVNSQQAYFKFLDQYLSAFDDACFAYFKHDVRPKLFRYSYQAKINHLFEDDDFKDVINSTINYPSLNKFYKKYCLKKTKYINTTTHNQKH